MPGAVIAIDQARPGPSVSSGSPGVARNDLWQSRLITLRDAAGGNNSWQWTLLALPPGSATALSGDTTATATCTPDLPGTYRVQLITNGGGPGNVQIRVARVRYDSTGTLVYYGWALPAFGEQDGESNYNGNLIAWSEVFNFIFADIQARFHTLEQGGSVNGQDITPNSVTTNTLTVTGDLLAGRALQRPFSKTVPGGGSDTLVTIPIADDSHGHIKLSFSAHATNAAFWDRELIIGLNVASGSGSLNVTNVGSKHTFGIPPTLSADWSAGVFTITGMSQQDAVLELTDNMSGGTRCRVNEAISFENLDGTSVTLSGLSVISANGPHTVAFVDDHHFDIPVVFTSDTGTQGTAVPTTPPASITYIGFVIDVVSP